MTNRPLNMCRCCGSTWYPRGQSVSARCPRCGDTDVDAASIIAIMQLMSLIWIVVICVSWLAFQIAKLVLKLMRAGASIVHDDAVFAAPKLKSASIAVASYRWLDRIPDWLQPIIWALSTSGLIVVPILSWQLGPSRTLLILGAIWMIWGFLAVLFVFRLLLKRVELESESEESMFDEES